MTVGLPVGAVMNCADNTGAKNLYIISVTNTGARLNRLPAASVGDMVMASCKKGKPELRKKGACCMRRARGGGGAGVCRGARRGPSLECVGAMTACARAHVCLSVPVPVRLPWRGRWPRVVVAVRACACACASRP